jgi:hypothetical protein
MRGKSKFLVENVRVASELIGWETREVGDAEGIGAPLVADGAEKRSDRGPSRRGGAMIVGKGGPGGDEGEPERRGQKE